MCTLAEITLLPCVKNASEDENPNLSSRATVTAFVFHLIFLLALIQCLRTACPCPPWYLAKADPTAVYIFVDSNSGFIYLYFYSFKMWVSYAVRHAWNGLE
jgi:hypothetical protein